MNTNRKFKVRVWSKILGKFLTKDEWFLDFDGNLHFREYDEDSNQYKPVFVPEDSYVVQQYTGLFDKNGVEICEGDIIQYTLSNSVFTGAVEWQNYGWVVQDFEYDGAYTICGAYNPWVSGNIFETPELLNKSEYMTK